MKVSTQSQTNPAAAPIPSPMRKRMPIALAMAGPMLPVAPTVMISRITSVITITRAPFIADSMFSRHEISRVTLALATRGMTTEGLEPPTMAPSNKLFISSQSRT